jgi:hypothetical protein
LAEGNEKGVAGESGEVGLSLEVNWEMRIL